MPERAPCSTGRLLATDLDRTLLPNGVQPESAGVRELLFSFLAQRGIELVYVTGRRLELVDAAIAEFSLARPGYVIGDVGSGMWGDEDGAWRPVEAWQRLLERDWGEWRGAELAAALADVAELRAQEAEAQGPFKASFYSDPTAAADSLRAVLADRLDALGLRATIVHSIDEAKGVGLVDVLPAASSKLRALAFLMGELGLRADQVVFAGDSGNDLEVLASPIPSVLVANAADEVRALAEQQTAAAGHRETLHCARGGLFGANGNYAAGILEGWAHFHGGDREAIAELARQQRT